jgi:hypothetical protein
MLVYHTPEVFRKRTNVILTSDILLEPWSTFTATSIWDWTIEASLSLIL